MLRYCALTRGIVFRYCGYTPACALGVRHYCSYSPYSQYVGLLSTRNLWAASTPIIFSVLELRFDLEHLSLWNLYLFTLSTKKHLFWGDIYCICSILLSRSQNIMAQPRPQAFFLYLRLRRIHWTYRASHLFRITNNIYFPVPYLYGIIVILIPHKFRKQYIYIVCPQKYVTLCVIHVNDGWIQLLLLNR